MNSSCQRCGRCCTQFGVCVTPFDVLRVCKATGMQPEEFLQLIPDFRDRERKEPAIIIDGERCLLVLKRQIDDVCFFYTGRGCRIYENRPSLCKTYPFKIKENKLENMESRSCIKQWNPESNEKQQYLDDCKQYKKEVEEYKEIAERWNKKGGGDFNEFLGFAVVRARPLKQFVLS